MNNNRSYIQHLHSTWCSLNVSGKGFFVFMLFSLAPSLSFLLMGIYNRIGLGSIAPYAKNIILVISLLFLFPMLREKIRIIDLLLYGAVVSFIYISPSIWPESQSFVNDNAGVFLWTVVPYYFVGLILEFNQHENILISISRLAFFVEILVQGLIIFGFTNTIGYSDSSDGIEQMVAAYSFLFATMYLFYQADRNGIFLDKVIAVLSFILLALMGSRDPVVVYAFFVMGYLILFKRYINYNIIKKVSIGLLFLLFYNSVNILMLFLLPVVQKIGFSTRIFDSIASGSLVNIEESNGRDDIWENLFYALNLRPEGYGWGGDRSLTLTGGYAHNLELELLVHFGYVFGGTIIAMIFILLVYTFNKAKRTDSSSFLFLVFCAGIMALQTSQTYISYPLLFLFIGYCVSLSRITSTY